MSVRTRMAPSPTGELHIGSLRTILYNWALAKSTGGQFVLRIEDTDKKREVAGATDRLLHVMRAYGLDWDEGPIFQSERLAIYQEHAEQLVEKGYAYYCFCTPDELSQMRAEQQARGLPVTKYNKSCVGIPPAEAKRRAVAGEECVVRLKVPENTPIFWDDLITGEVTVNSNELDDQVLLKSDGYPTYHLAVVVDDHLMNITHVLRGTEWLPSTPKQILLYNCFGWDIPKFGHLPNLKDIGSTKKMSKRVGDVHAQEFLKNGYLPEAVLNFLMLLGWNPGTEQEFFSLADFATVFSLEKVHKTDLVAFDRDKLVWMNGQYIRQLSVEELWARLQAWAQEYEVDLGVSSVPTAKLLLVLGLVQEKMKTLAEFSDSVSYFFTVPTLDRALVTKFAGDRAGLILQDFQTVFRAVAEDAWDFATLEKVSTSLLAEKGYTPKEAYMTLRVALTGREASPHIFDVLVVLGTAETLSRLDSAQKLL